MMSPSMAGDNNIYINLRPHTGVEATSSVITTVNSIIQIRLLKGYTPGEAGEPGTFQRPNEAWLNYSLISNTSYASVNIDPNLDNFEITYFCDKDFCCFIIRAPEPIYSANSRANLLAFGIPKDSSTDKVASRDTFVIGTGSGTYSPVTWGAGAIYIDSPTGQADLTAQTAYAKDYYAPMRPSDWLGRVKMVYQEYGNSVIGNRNQLVGIYLLNNAAPLDRDIIHDSLSGKIYEVATLPDKAYTSFSTNQICYQIG